MLTERYLDDLSSRLVSTGTWHPFPKAHERAPWTSVSDGLRSAHIERGISALKFDWPVAPATLFLDYTRTGNRSRYQTQVRDARRETLSDLVFAECLEGEGRFLDRIIDGIWATCEESFWGVPAHLKGRQNRDGGGLPDVTDPVVDLFAAEAGALLAWTDYLLEQQLDTVSTLIRDRIRLETERRILIPALERHFNWMGPNEHGRRPNNWNPWICSNWLACSLVLDTDPDRQIASVSKILKTVDCFLDPHPADGGCDEGPNYWNHAAGSIHDVLEILYSATNGRIDIYDDPLIGNMAAFLYRTQIGDGYVVNFADAQPQIDPVATNIFSYGKRVGDPDMCHLGAWYAEQQKLARDGFTSRANLGRRLAALSHLDELLQTEAKQPLPARVWLPDTQVAVGRSEVGSSSGYFLAVKGGNNGESHNHNDIGNLVVFIDAKPLIIDIGVEEYTAKTFGPDRYDIWTMRSDHHTVPTINGIEQATGADFQATDLIYAEDDAGFTFTCSLKEAYPNDAGIDRWIRSATLDTGAGVTIEDNYEMERVEHLQMTFMTPCEIEQDDRGVVLREVEMGNGRKSASGRIDFDTAKMEIKVDTYPLANVKFKRGTPWGEHLYRLRVLATNPPLSGTLTWHITR